MSDCAEEIPGFLRSSERGILGSRALDFRLKTHVSMAVFRYSALTLGVHDYVELTL